MVALEDEKTRKRYRIDRLGKKIIDLPIETQIKLFTISDKYEVSKEAIIAYVDNNPLLYDRIPKKYKDEIIKAGKSDYLQTLPDEYFRKIKYLDESLLKSLDYDVEKIKHFLLQPAAEISLYGYKDIYTL